MIEPSDVRHSTSRVNHTVIVIAGMVLLVVISAVAVERALFGSSDFSGFHQALDAAAAHFDLSDDRSVDRYPPTFQLLFYPFTLMPLWLAATVWTLLNLAACIVLPLAFRALGDIPIHAQWVVWVAVLPFTIDNIVLGQSGVVLLAMVASALALARRHWPGTCSLLLGGAAAFKVMPLLFLAVPGVVLRRWRIPLLTGGTLAVLCLGTVGLFGPAETIAEFREWTHQLTTKHDAEGMIETGRSLRHNNQGVVITIARVLGAVPPAVAPSGPRLADAPMPIAMALAAAVQSAVVLTWLLATIRLRGREDPRAWLGLFAMTALAMLAIAPLVWTHYFIWVAPALMLLVHRPRLVLAFGGLSLLMLAIREARFVGVHMGLSLSLMPLLWRELFHPHRPGPGRQPDHDPVANAPSLAASANPARHSM